MNLPATAVHHTSAGVSPQRYPAAFESLRTVTRCRPDEVIYYQEDPADYWYSLVSGAARKTALTFDGRRHIITFLLAGDLFGFGSNDKHRFSVEAIVDGTTVAKYPRRRVEALAESDPTVARTVREAAFHTIAHLQARMVLIGRSSALERVSAFVLETAARLPKTGRTVILPMSRYDIADYLAISVETVSRAVTILRGRGVITLCGSRHIEIIDRGALCQLVYGSRQETADLRVVDQHQRQTACSPAT